MKWGQRLGGTGTADGWLDPRFSYCYQAKDAGYGPTTNDPFWLWPPVMVDSYRWSTFRCYAVAGSREGAPLRPAGSHRWARCPGPGAERITTRPVADKEGLGWRTHELEFGPPRW